MYKYQLGKYESIVTDCIFIVFQIPNIWLLHDEQKSNKRYIFYFSIFFYFLGELFIDEPKASYRAMGFARYELMMKG